MHNRASCFAEHARGIFGCAILVSIFIISGCANKPSITPPGYTAQLESAIIGEKKFKLAQKNLLQLDFPAIVTVDPEDTQIEIFWTKDGEIIWTEPFWTKVTYWRFDLIEHDVPDGTPALCYTQWAEVDSNDVTPVLCNITAKNYIGKPLHGVLSYTYSPTKPKDDDETPYVGRLIYMVETGAKPPEGKEGATKPTGSFAR